MSHPQNRFRSTSELAISQQGAKGSLLVEPSSEVDGGIGRLAGSRRNYERALKVLPGGTTRVTVKRTPIPIYIERGEGAYLIDVDGNRYLDFNGNYTALIHGHAFAPIVTALQDQLNRGSSFSNPTGSEIKLAELLAARVPIVEKVRFTNSGTEAVLFAVKAARAYTRRTKIAKLEGAYHGAYDWVEVSESSNPGNWGGQEPEPTAFYAGMPGSVLSETVVLPINDIETSLELIRRNAEDLACILIDVMPSRAGLVKLSPDYLKMLSTIAREKNIVLISDEVLNFRYGYQGISAEFSFRPDIITFGKIIGGGMPVGAVGGSNDIMDVFNSSKGAPLVPHGGTFAANPLSMTAGLVCMEHLTPESFSYLQKLGDRARCGINEIAQRRRIPICVTGGGSIFRYHLFSDAPTTYRRSFISPERESLHKEISSRLLAYGVMIPSDTSASCSTAMSLEDIDQLLECFDSVLGEIPDFTARLLSAQIDP